MSHVPTALSASGDLIEPIVGSQLLDLHKRFKRLQNGSDIRGVAVDGELRTRMVHGFLEAVLHNLHGGACSTFQIHRSFR
jgi:hypothetical protein